MGPRGCAGLWLFPGTGSVAVNYFSMDCHRCKRCSSFNIIDAPRGIVNVLVWSQLLVYVTVNPGVQLH